MSKELKKLKVPLIQVRQGLAARKPPFRFQVAVFGPLGKSRDSLRGGRACFSFEAPFQHCDRFTVLCLHLAYFIPLKPWDATKHRGILQVLLSVGRHNGWHSACNQFRLPQNPDGGWPTRWRKKAYICRITNALSCFTHAYCLISGLSRESNS